jgi:hypothetical protein
LTVSLFLLAQIMKTLEIKDIQARVSNTEDARAKYREMAAKWEKMWLLDAGYSKTLQEAIEKDGREQVTTADPFNVVNLAQRLISTMPRIDCPPKEVTEDATKHAQSKEQFLLAMWQQMAKLQGRNILYDASWMSLVRGRVVFEVKWIKEALPKKLQDKRFPISIRVLDPCNVGVHRGPLYVEYAYHKYSDKVVNVRQKYPKLSCWDERDFADENNDVNVVDFWWMDADSGDVWNAILVEDEFAKKPKKTSYEFIPIIEVYGDSAPTKDEAYRGLSILYSLDGPWQYKCRLQSNLGTGVLWATWPFFTVTNEEGHEIPDIKVRPGATENVPMGTKIDQILPQINLNTIEGMLAKVDESLQQSAFPNVMYGDAGSMQAGYGVSLLSDAARGRIKSFLEYLELGVMMVNEAVMSLIEVMDDDDKGVEIWGKNAKDNKLYKLCLYAKDLGGYYENMVTLRPNLPQDDMARQAFGLQLQQGGNLSRQTLWDKFLNIEVPTDEQDRIWTDRLFDSPELGANIQLTKLVQIYPKTWEMIIKGTPLEETARKMGILPPPPPPMGPPMGPPPGMGGPPGMMPPGMPGLPPMPPDGGPPPGMMGPPPPGGPMPLQPPAIPMPMGGGMPPAMQGQIEPEMMGLPPDGDPALFAQLMGQPLPPGEEMNLLAGLPQEGLPRGF